MKKTILYSLLLIFGTIQGVCSNSNILLKMCPLYGERFITKVPDQNSILEIIEKGFDTKGYDVYTNSKEILSDSSNSEIHYYCDVFVYQYSADYPTIKITIRTKEKKIFEESKNVKMFLDIQTAYEKVAKKLLPEIPISEKLQNRVSLKTDLIFDKNSVNMIGLATNSMMESYTKKYLIEFDFMEESSIRIFYEDSIENYIKNLINYTGFREKVRGNEITITVEIDEYGFTKIVSKNYPKGLNSKQEQRLDNLVKGFPLWVNDKKKRTIAVIKIGTK